MPNKFKAKDKVVCTQANTRADRLGNDKLVKHEQYNVRDVLGNFIVRLDGVHGNFCTSRFELIGRV